MASRIDDLIAGGAEPARRCRTGAGIAFVTLALLLTALVENCGADLLRMKGIVNVREDPLRPAVIHGVQHVYHAPVWLPRWPSDDRRTRIVFIGRGLSEAWVGLLIEMLEAEVADELTRRVS